MVSSLISSCLEYPDMPAAHSLVPPLQTCSIRPDGSHSMDLSRQPWIKLRRQKGGLWKLKPGGRRPRYHTAATVLAGSTSPSRDHQLLLDLT